MRHLVVGPYLAQRIEHVLGVAQVGEIGDRADDDLVDARQHRTGPFRSRHAERRAR